MCGEPVALGGGSSTDGSTGDEPGTTGATTSSTSGDASGDVPTSDGLNTASEFSSSDNESGNFDESPGDDGCGCRHEAPSGGGWLLGLGGLLLARRRRR